jgi:hypothetical protein
MAAAPAAIAAVKIDVGVVDHQKMRGVEGNH